VSEIIEHTSTTPVRLLDIGSGGGFPGIPLKIVMPELQMTLLDSVGKKVKAMNHFVTELGLTDITAIQERAEVLAKSPEHK
jgi:16S rRNA (guanine527-N7)-methyltransferase